MEIRVVDFDTLTRNYKNYQDGISNISEVKKTFLKRLDPIKKQMEEIINHANSGLILDNKTQKEKEETFRRLQDEAMLIDSDFKSTMKEMHNDLNKKTFDELTEIINEWTTQNSVDLIIGKMEVVFLKEKYEITNNIIEVIKQKDLYVNLETETENV
jgi:Skp family chaperone for outer membrane proteins